jgi:hypothetical protein
MQIILPPLLDDSRVSHVGGHGLGALNQRRDGYEKVSKCQSLYLLHFKEKFVRIFLSIPFQKEPTIMLL